MSFELTKVAPLGKRVRSRDACIYLQRVMNSVGWTPPSNWTRWIYMIWTVTTTFCCIIYMPGGFFINYFLEIKSFTPVLFLTSLQAGINAAGCAIKASLTFLNIWRFRRANELLDRMDKRVVTDAERLQIHQVVARCSRIFLAYQTVYYFFITSNFASGLLNNVPPWNIYNPLIKWRRSKLELYAASWLEYVIMLFTGTQNLITDTYPLMYGILLRTHINLLKQRVEKLRTEQNDSNEKHYEDLIDCISDHKLIIEYSSIIRPVISQTIFTQFLIIGVILGLCLINLFFFADLFIGITTAVFIVAICLETFPFCYICNLIMDDCETLTNTLFQSNWIDADRRYRTTLLYFLHNVQQPIVFKAGGFMQICVSSNITVAKFAFSVLAIVNQMNITERFT
ncbi:odorant receptor 42b-like [Scaptodrosophila lebanonensis]|uniref:Odorant receptor n=1 Tax=Drosophila lebanonensis TaxID=7225 RepID=A0A6J2UBY4_DROLE|nr:odorant receptor 42b-like [Scaptodrosophila lebanonensis]